MWNLPAHNKQQIASLLLQAAFLDEYQCHNQLEDWRLKRPNKRNGVSRLVLSFRTSRDLCGSQTFCRNNLKPSRFYYMISSIHWEVENQEDHRFTKKITFITFTFSLMFSFQIQQPEISQYWQAESAKFLIHFYLRKVIWHKKISGQLITIDCCAKRTKKTLWNPTVIDAQTRRSEKLI